MKLAILSSGSGKNGLSVLKAARSEMVPLKVEVVVHNGSGQGRELAKELAYPVHSIDHRKFANREAFEAVLLDILSGYACEAIVLCSFNRLLSPFFFRHCTLPVVNSHPSILPSFPGFPNGLKAVDAATSYGVCLAGATVHFVDESMDGGPIIAQGAVTHAADEEQGIFVRRVLELEHLLKLQVLLWLAEGRVELQGRLSRIRQGKSQQFFNCLQWAADQTSSALPDLCLFWPPLEQNCLDLYRSVEPEGLWRAPTGEVGMC